MPLVRLALRHRSLGHRVHQSVAAPVSKNQTLEDPLTHANLCHEILEGQRLSTIQEVIRFFEKIKEELNLPIEGVLDLDKIKYVKLSDKKSGISILNTECFEYLLVEDQKGSKYSPLRIDKTKETPEDTEEQDIDSSQSSSPTESHEKKLEASSKLSVSEDSDTSTKFCLALQRYLCLQARMVNKSHFLN
eukprot:GHVP01020982.1.p1 GENE.GHVP01020982.1~~GHVP01020982.1.p1  ORF type:complete len:190 (-),score=18.19 GHVP01020982.1:231-800(-)